MYIYSKLILFNPHRNLVAQLQIFQSAYTLNFYVYPFVTYSTFSSSKGKKKQKTFLIHYSSASTLFFVPHRIFSTPSDLAMSSPPVSVTLGDVTITEDDVRLLREPNWLNDQLLSLWVELLRRNSDPNNNDNGSDVAIIPPNLAFFIQYAAHDDVSLSLKSLSLKSKRRVVLFINDSAAEASGIHGTHWSVLCYDRPTDTFRTYDSAPGGSSNFGVSRNIANILVKHLGTDRKSVSFGHVNIPCQNDAYSCGDFSCAVAQILLDDDVNKKFDGLREMADTVRPRLRNAIDELRGKKDGGKEDASKNKSESLNKT